MTQDLSIGLMTQAMLIVLIVSLPPILVATIVGLAVALFQALTQIQDQTLPYAVKLTATLFAIIFASNMIFDDVYMFALSLFRDFPTMIR